MIEIPGHLYIAIGAVTASIIAGIFSYFNLVTSKETKVSEFRQDWINELRKEITKYVASMQALVVFESYINEHLEKEITNLDIINRRAELYDSALTAYNSIHLRINKNEKNKKAKEINDQFILALDEAHEHRKAGEPGDLGYLLEQIINKAEALLKHEWNRVRDGEQAYRWSKNGALSLLILSVAAFVFVGFAISTYKLDVTLSTRNQSVISKPQKNPKQDVTGNVESLPNNANPANAPKARG